MKIHFGLGMLNPPSKIEPQTENFRNNDVFVHVIFIYTGYSPG